MVALVKTDVVFVPVPDRPPTVGGRNRRSLYGTLAFGDGVKTYPSKGVPLPVPVAPQGGMGMARTVERITILDMSNADAAQGLSIQEFTWDRVAQTIRMFHQSTGTEFLTSEAPTATVLGVLIEGI